MSESRLDNAHLKALMGKVKLRVDPEIDDMFPEFNSARVSIRIAQGKEYSLFVKNAKGSMENPFSPTDVIDKFLWITQGLLPKAAALDIVGKVQNFESITDIGAFVEGLMIDKEH